MARDFQTLYKEDVDFEQLAEEDEAFKKQQVLSASLRRHTDRASLKNNGQLDFSNPAAVK